MTINTDWYGFHVTVTPECVLYGQVHRTIKGMLRRIEDEVVKRAKEQKDGSRFIVKLRQLPLRSDFNS